MPFCTLLEWDHDFDLARYEAMNQRAGGHDPLPDGCLCRVVGPVDTGARILEVWASADEARQFSEANGHLVAEFQLPPPTRVAAFETTVYRASTGPTKVGPGTPT